MTLLYHASVAVFCSVMTWQSNASSCRLHSANGMLRRVARRMPTGAWNSKYMLLLMECLNALVLGLELPANHISQQ